ncbi:helix-turn-helix transcriptional regulator [Azospirillum sp. SYSU D00513]|uniref:helix-turn-helix domain-containing protein n=1 Tax=Azospirillum sp. SYSU D00513 TaxID=2812561 RepID=UPI001A95D7DA|nr:helix-turn-helix transcriptional regulator [Azospirillum sp. SYSU D00513]
MLQFGLMAPGDIAHGVAERARSRRLGLGLTQAELSERASVNIWSLRRFEATGKIAFDALIRIAFVLDAVEEFGGLFPEPEFRSPDELISRPKRQRGRRKGRAAD